NAGSTDISITQVNMDADSGGIITPSSDTAHLNILGSNSGSSSSGGGGYSGYSSSVSGTTSTVTPTSTKTIQISAVTTGVPLISVTNTVIRESQVVTPGMPKATNQVPFESPRTGSAIFRKKRIITNFLGIVSTVAAGQAACQVNTALTTVMKTTTKAFSDHVDAVFA
ncbi:MAG: hypothetical protein NTW33_02940, partial [Methanoregula sp.]|nr:hypothetical protein [Methanoregula sp.]